MFNFLKEQIVGEGSFFYFTWGNIISFTLLTAILFSLSSSILVPRKKINLLSFFVSFLLLSVFSVSVNGLLNLVSIVLGGLFAFFTVAYFKQVSLRFLLSLTFILILTPLHLLWVSFFPFALLGVFVYLKVKKVYGENYAQFIVYETLFALGLHSVPFLGGWKVLKNLPLPDSNMEKREGVNLSGEGSGGRDDEGGAVAGVEGNFTHHSDKVLNEAVIERGNVEGLKVEVEDKRAGELVNASFLLAVGYLVSLPALVLTLYFLF